MARDAWRTAKQVGPSIVRDALPFLALLPLGAIFSSCGKLLIVPLLAFPDGQMRGADVGPASRVTALSALWVGLLYDADAQARGFSAFGFRLKPRSYRCPLLAGAYLPSS